MSDPWQCPECSEENADSYAECWNCQATRPGYSTYAEQVKRIDEQHAEWERQNEIGKRIQADMIRQNQVVDAIQEEAVRQNELAAALLELEKSNQERLANLLNRWEKITEIIEMRAK